MRRRFYIKIITWQPQSQQEEGAEVKSGHPSYRRKYAVGNQRMKEGTKWPRNYEFLK